MGTKRTSQGATLKISIASVFTTVFSTVKIEGPDGETQFEDVTDLASTYVEDGEDSGLMTPGSVKCEGFHDEADPTHVAMLAVLLTPAVGVYGSWKITSPAGAVKAFTGKVKTFTPMFEAKKFQNYSAEIKLRSPATATAAP